MFFLFHLMSLLGNIIWDSKLLTGKTAVKQFVSTKCCLTTFFFGKLTLARVFYIIIGHISVAWSFCSIKINYTSNGFLARIALMGNNSICFQQEWNKYISSNVKYIQTHNVVLNSTISQYCWFHWFFVQINSAFVIIRFYLFICLFVCLYICVCIIIIILFYFVLLLFLKHVYFIILHTLDISLSRHCMYWILMYILEHVSQ